MLDDFDGTILLVSHDRYLVDALATQIWALDEGELIVFEGPYREYVQARAGAPAAPEPAPPPAPAPPKKGAEARGKSNGQGQPENPRLSPYARARRLKEIEARIQYLEVQLVNLSGELGAASEAGDAARVHTLGEEYVAAEAELDACLDEWESLVEPD